MLKLKDRRIRFGCVGLLCLVLLASWSCSKNETNESTGINSTRDATNKPTDQLDFYTVDHYDIARNPADDLATTIQRAKAEKKHILVQVGGDWCGWCKLMSHFIDTNDRVRDNIRNNFLLMKVTYGGDQKNEAFLSRYPQIPGYPHLFVLDSDGNLLHSQGTAELEEGHGYNEQVYLAFLDKWKPVH